MPVITYVDDRYCEREWYGRIQPPIDVLGSIKRYLSMPPGDILIIHGGQADWDDTESPKNRHQFIEAVLRVCDGGGRAIIFSGGQPKPPRLRETLAAASLEEGLHYLLLTAIQNLEQEIDFELLLQAQPSAGWRIDSVKRRHAVPTLLSLFTLTQAALLSFDEQQLEESTRLLLRWKETECALRSHTADDVLAERQRLQTPAPWQAVLGRNSSALLLAMEREWPHGAPPRHAVKQLIHTFCEGGSAMEARLLSAAFKELHEALRINEGLQP